MPIPRGLLELAGDFKHAIQDAKKELEGVSEKIKEQRAAGAQRDPELYDRRRELLVHLKGLKEKQEVKEEQVKRVSQLESIVAKGRGWMADAARIATGRVTPEDFKRLGEWAGKK